MNPTLSSREVILFFIGPATTLFLFSFCNPSFLNISMLPCLGIQKQTLILLKHLCNSVKANPPRHHLVPGGRRQVVKINNTRHLRAHWCLDQGVNAKLPRRMVHRGLNQSMTAVHGSHQHSSIRANIPNHTFHFMATKSKVHQRSHHSIKTTHLCHSVAHGQNFHHSIKTTHVCHSVAHGQNFHHSINLVPGGRRQVVKINNTRHLRAHWCLDQGVNAKLPRRRLHRGLNQSMKAKTAVHGSHQHSSIRANIPNHTFHFMATKSKVHQRSHHSIKTTHLFYCIMGHSRAHGQNFHHSSVTLTPSHMAPSMTVNLMYHRGIKIKTVVLG
ncbi:hypothetical protein NC652_024950 [Populus alba x Populus x berolinensis]|nr:hypothetical protein NC652_024950 [Populus alba x Populus x berolinensis]